jgi:hypothetical protein
MIERTKRFITWSALSLSDIEDLRYYLKKEEQDELMRKSAEILRTFCFTNFESQAAAEKMFAIGYMSAHLEYKEEQN